MNNGYSKIGNFQCRCGAVKLEEMKSFEDFFQAFLAYLDDSIKAMLKIDRTQEAYLHLINPGHLYSSTVDNSLKLGVDAFSRGTVYKNTSIGFSGLGTAVDALMAVKKAVFDEKMLSLTELRDILNQDWEGAEKLRLKLLYAPEKYGNGITEVDKYADIIAKFAAARISNQPNGRGGCFILSGHGARQFIVQGQRTGATPDGRKSGAEFSKNLSPTMGADTNGITALSNSICTMDYHDLPGDFPLDVMMHPATVQGEEGLEAMKNYIFAHFANGGMQIHFNLFDTETLRDAQAHPEKYPHLIVRIWGWSAYFVELDECFQNQVLRRQEYTL
jgi:formate C-acetyltransferase